MDPTQMDLSLDGQQDNLSRCFSDQINHLATKVENRVDPIRMDSQQNNVEACFTLFGADGSGRGSC